MKFRPMIFVACPITLAMQGALYAAEPSGLEEITITGSRITREGYESPTPLTTLSAAEIFGQTANSSLKETLQTLPVIAGGFNITTGAGTPSFNQAGISSIEMRNLGINRTLILLDGQRSVGSLASGVVDTDNFPQQLLQRVEVVTGGASAVYGSDAVAGVVNFILDREFTGVKGEVSGGLTQYDDAENSKVAVAAGFPFAEGRGHFLISGEAVDNNGISGVGDRDWGWTTKEYIVNPQYTPTNGQPEYVTRNNAFLATATHGGLITFGPLRGTAFGEGGTPYQFTFGEGVARDVFMAGGDYLSTRTADAFSLLPEQERKNLFTRVSFDIADNLNVFAQVSRGINSTLGIAFPHYLVSSAVASSGGVQVLTGNPFIPASVQERMTQLGVPSFRVGTMTYDLPWVLTETTRATNRYVIGAEGEFSLFDNDWNWNAYGQLGRTSGSAYTHNARINSRFTEALDAVRAPNGSIVCRSTLTNANSTCQPFNPMGTGVNTQAAIDYVTGSAHSYQTVDQDVWAISMDGEVFDNWAGPVSLALSAEYREEHATVDPDAIARMSGWHSGNHQPLDARTHVTEGAIELLMPLLVDKPFAQQWDLSAAYRYTDYQLSGGVDTWKIGSTWTPISGLRLRGTISHDIRAASISDLFQAQNFGLGAQINPWSNVSNTFTRVQNGSPDLTPEIGDTVTLGVVVQPAFAADLTLSVDYWRTEVEDAIQLITANTVVTLCYQGWTDLCPWITFDPAAGAPFSATSIITSVQQANFNLAIQKARGVDVELNYRLPMSSIAESLPGSLSMRLLGTRYLENLTENGFTVTADIVGAALPKTILNGNISYTLDKFTAGLGMRYFASTVSSNLAIECTSACPTSTTTYTTFDDISRDGALYYDLSLSYAPEGWFGEDGRIFLNVRNLTNEDPELVPAIGGGPTLPYIYSRTIPNRWDSLGRTYRAGLEFNF